EHNRHLDRGVAPGIEHLSGPDAFDLAHVSRTPLLLVLLMWRKLVQLDLVSAFFARSHSASSASRSREGSSWPRALASASMARKRVRKRAVEPRRAASGSTPRCRARLTIENRRSPTSASRWAGDPVATAASS